METPNVIERGVRLYARLVEREPALADEFRRSRETFFGTSLAVPTEDAGAARRHLEWFLFERPSEFLDGVPAERLADPWAEAADDELGDLSSSFPMSVAGIYEVTGHEPGAGLWLVDLLGRGEYPIREPDLSAEFEVGDLLVGRLYPLGDAAGGAFQMSPAAVTFRNPRLRDALHSDMEALRASRRGFLRIEQVELERMFWRVADESEATPGEDPREEALATLTDGGVDEERARTWLADVESADNPSAAAGDLLDRLAFDTEVDLERARRSLPAVAHGAARAEAVRRSSEADAPGADARAALEAFDRGRAEGRDLDGLFDQLERDLGLDAPGDAEDDEGTPDFPGVVGAMVTEYVWDRERQGAPVGEAATETLARFAAATRDVGAFEDLGLREFTAYAAVRLFDEPAPGPDTLRASLHALADFASWTRDAHEMPLWSDYEDVHMTLLEDAERLWQINVEVPPAGDADAGELFEVTAVEPGPRTRVMARRPRGDNESLELDANYALEARDWIRLRGGRLVRVYPSVARRAWESVSDSAARESEPR